MAVAFSGFDWDAGNWPKCGKHGVPKVEIEALFDGNIDTAEVSAPGMSEDRFLGIGERHRAVMSSSCSRSDP